MKQFILGNSRNIVTANYSRRADAEITPGNFLVATTLTPNLTPYCVFKNIYAGVAYVSLPPGTSANIHYTRADISNSSVGINLAVNDFGMATVTIWRGFVSSDGTVARQASVTHATPIQTNADGWIKIAWLWNTEQSKVTDTRIFINNTFVSIGSLPYENVTDIPMNHNYIFTPGTPAGYKLGMLWATFSTRMTPEIITQISDEHGFRTPYFMGRFGEYPLMEPAQCYVNCNDIDGIKNYAGGVFFAPVNNPSHTRIADNITIPNQISPYPKQDGPLEYMTWDTENEGFSVAATFYDPNNEFLVYILRCNSLNSLMTSARTLTLYTYNLFSKKLTRLFEVAGNYNMGSNNEYWLGTKLFFVNKAYNYFVFAENDCKIYVADLSSGTIIGSYDYVYALNSIDYVMASNRKDFYIFYAADEQVRPIYQSVAFNATDNTVAFGTERSIPGLSITGNSRFFMHVLKVKPSNVALNQNEVMLSMHKSWYITEAPVHSGLALAIFDTSTGTFAINPIISEIWSSNTNPVFTTNPGSVGSLFVYDDNISYIIYRSNGLPLAANLPYYLIIFDPITLDVTPYPAEYTWQARANGGYPTDAAQRVDKKIFCIWGDDNKIWLHRGNPIFDNWTNIETTTFISYGSIHPNCINNSIVITTSGAIITGQLSNNTTEAPVAFLPLENRDS